ncbi:hypothetical protein Cgig2_030700 [Carnegiea gigantea]|uniref:Uncharacterized protein n=1 Tax=Carnegiea gigantea TaxID=171969 RepID=A0A9Q1GUY7_9CARY|nr:hypothetical protein Cgig2_030700 [Carnegiea gigantea]
MRIGVLHWQPRKTTLRRSIKKSSYGDARLPRPFPEDYYDLCSYFILADAEDATRNFRIPELVQANFYAIVVNEALELGILSRNLDEDLKRPSKVGPSPSVSKLPAKIDGRVVADFPPKNQFRETEKIPYAKPIYEPDTPSWSSFEYSSTSSIVNTEEETLPELTAEGYLEGDSQSASDSRRLSVEVCSISTSTPERRDEGSSTSSHSSVSTPTRGRGKGGRPKRLLPWGHAFQGLMRAWTLGMGRAHIFPTRG